MKISIGIDKNGNKVLKIGGVEGLRGFSIQTNGNLPAIHRLGCGAFRDDADKEIKDYVFSFGTAKQKVTIDSIGFVLAINAFFKRGQP